MIRHNTSRVPFSLFLTTVMCHYILTSISFLSPSDSPVTCPQSYDPGHVIPVMCYFLSNFPQTAGFSFFSHCLLLSSAFLKLSCIFRVHPTFVSSIHRAGRALLLILDAFEQPYPRFYTLAISIL